MSQFTKLRIEAPEKITFTYRYAEQGTRMAAFFIDTAIQFAVLLIFVFLFIGTGDAFRDSITEDLSLVTAGFLYLIIFFMQWFYFLFFEAFWNGQTPGKRLMKIRVINHRGKELDFPSLLLRNFMRAVDGFPFLHLLGGIIFMIDKRKRRIGDILSQTIVVYEEKKKPDVPMITVPFTIMDLNQKEKHDIKLHAKLEEKDLYVIRRFFNEKVKIPRNAQDAVCKKLADEVRKKMKIDDDNPAAVYADNDENFLKMVYSAHAEDDSK